MNGRGIVIREGANMANIGEPYSNVPSDKKSKMDKCVNDVMATGKDKKAAIAICYSSVVEGKPLEEAVMDFDKGLLVSEAATKREDGKDFPASDFAYVPDSESPSTWKLRLTSTPGGEPDSGIVGAAIAALGKGFRGNKVEIPAGDLGKVKAKVRAAWKKANPEKDPNSMPPAVKEAGENVKEWDEGMAMPMPTPNVYSFADMFKVQTAQDAAEGARQTLQDFIGISNNILWASPDQVPDKASALRALIDELVTVLPQMASGQMAEAATVKSKVRAAIKALDELLEDKEVPSSIRDGVKGLRATFSKTWADLAGDRPSFERHAEAEKFAESYTGVIVSEVDTKVDPARSPINMKVQLIRPGWGNSTDNHYYTPAVLKAAEKVFEGKKMYTTNHVAGEKNVMTEVSKINRIVGYTQDGAPIADVTVFHPAFAEMVRARQEAGQLDSLECSVLGSGTAKPFELEGRKGKMVESITDIESVDWVTRAGAGGHALEIAESETNPKPEGATMADQNKIENQEPDPVTTPAPVAEVAETSATAPEPTRLSETEVTALLKAETRLPEVSRARLAELQYSDGEAVKEAITKELAYLKDAMGSGKPFGLGASQPAPSKTPDEIREAYNAAWDQVNKTKLS